MRPTIQDILHRKHDKWHRVYIYSTTPVTIAICRYKMKVARTWLDDTVYCNYQCQIISSLKVIIVISVWFFYSILKTVFRSWTHPTVQFVNTCIFFNDERSSLLLCKLKTYNETGTRITDDSIMLIFQSAEEIMKALHKTLGGHWVVYYKMWALIRLIVRQDEREHLKYGSLSCARTRVCVYAISYAVEG